MTTPQRNVFRVTEKVCGAHPNPHHANYPLLPGDLLSEWEDGTFCKFAPGLGISGFVLTDEQKATLEPVEKVPPIKMVGLAEYIAGESA